jgi:hypothetical protein
VIALVGDKEKALGGSRSRRRKRLVQRDNGQNEQKNEGKNREFHLILAGKPKLTREVYHRKTVKEGEQET